MCSAGHARQAARAQIRRVRHQGAQGITCGLKQHGGHHGHIRELQGIENPGGQGEDAMVAITVQEPHLLESQPALHLEIRALGTGSVPTGVVPRTCVRHDRQGTPGRLAAQGCGPALHNGVCRSADMGGERVVSARQAATRPGRRVGASPGPWVPPNARLVTWPQHPLSPTISRIPPPQQAVSPTRGPHGAAWKPERGTSAGWRRSGSG